MGVTTGLGGFPSGPFKARHRWVAGIHGSGKERPESVSTQAMKIVGERKFKSAVATFSTIFKESAGIPNAWGRTDKQFARERADTQFTQDAGGWVGFRIMEATAHRLPPFTLVARDIAIFRRLHNLKGGTRLVPIRGWSFPGGATYGGVAFALETKGPKWKEPRKVAFMFLTPTADGLAVTDIQGVKGHSAEKEWLGGEEWYAYMLQRLVKASKGFTHEPALHVMPEHFPVYAKILREFSGHPLLPGARRIEPVHTIGATWPAIKINVRGAKARRRINRAKDTIKRWTRKLRPR